MIDFIPEKKYRFLNTGAADYFNNKPATYIGKYIPENSNEDKLYVFIPYGRVTPVAVSNEAWLASAEEYKEPRVYKRYVHVFRTDFGGIYFSFTDVPIPEFGKVIKTIPIEYIDEMASELITK